MNKLKLPNIAIPVITVGTLLLIPILVSFYYIDSQTIFNMFAPDSMYYMGIANNFLKFGIPTFDGETAINGFHPLWELVLIGMFKIFSIQHHYQIYAVFVLSVFLVYASYVITSYALCKIVGPWPGLIATLTLFPGAYSLFFEPRRHLFNDPGILDGLSPYSAINGMETSLSLALWAFFFFGLISRFLFLSQRLEVSHDIQSFFPYSSRLCLAMLVLCRLDDCFLVVAIGIFVFAQSGVIFRKKINALLHILWPTAVALTIYITFNELTVGSPLPVSGTSKMSVDIARNLHILFVVLSGQSTEFVDWWNMAVRLYPVIFSLLVGLLLCIYFGRRYKNIILRPTDTSSTTALWSIFGLYLVLKATFLLLFVTVFKQGYWYYFPMVVVCNVIFALAIGFYIRGNSKKILGAFFICFAVIIFRMPNDIYFIKSTDDHYSIGRADFDSPLTESNNIQNYATISYALWKNSDEIRKFLLGHAPNTRLVDNWDGMYVYLLDIPGDSITGLASSSKELERRKAIGTWQSLVSNGFSIVPGYGYVSPQAFPQIIRVVEVLHPPTSPIAFYKIELTN